MSPVLKNGTILKAGPFTHMCYNADPLRSEPGNVRWATAKEQAANRRRKAS